jgi:hypothetical protein
MTASSLAIKLETKEPEFFDNYPITESSQSTHMNKSLQTNHEWIIKFNVIQISQDFIFHLLIRFQYFLYDISGNF